MNKINKIKELCELYLSRILNIPLVKPQTVTITLTSTCNLKCIMCDHWKLKNQEELSLEEIKRFIDQIKGWDINEVELSGGEPFMRKDIWEIIQYASLKNIGMNITTNGTLLNKKNIEKLFRYKINRIQISLDGIGKTQDKIRGVKGSYDKIVKTVKQLKNGKGQRNSNMQINATTVIMQQNLHGLVDLVHLTKKIGFDSITFQPVNDSNLSIGKQKRFNPLRVNDLQELNRQIDKLIGIRRKENYIGNPVSYLKSIKNYFKNEKSEDIKCYAGFIGAIITPQGRLWTCMGDYGDLKKENIQTVWKSKEAKIKRKLIKKCKNACLYPCYLSSKGKPFIKTLLNIIKNG